MGSIYVHWRGCCDDQNRQRELVREIQKIAKRSEARIVGPAVERPKFLEMMTAPREDLAAQIPPIREFDGAIQGNLILDPLVASRPKELMNSCDEAGLTKDVIEEGGVDRHELGCISSSRSPAQWCLRCDELSVFGIDFELFDPRRLYPNANRMSFVFINCPEIPALHGSLCQVEKQQQCQAYQSKAIRDADWFITTPNIHVRYLFEEWADLLLSWVKYVFISDLYFCRYNELSNYESFRSAVGNLSVETVKNSFAEHLIEQFEQEADEWTARMTEMA